MVVVSLTLPSAVQEREEGGVAQRPQCRRRRRRRRGRGRRRVTDSPYKLRSHPSLAGGEDGADDNDGRLLRA